MKIEELKSVTKLLAAELAEVMAKDMRSLYLFGSIMVEEDFHWGISDVNTFIVFKDDVENRVISKVSEVYKRFRKYPLSIPLMMKEGELVDAKDVFPVEFVEIKEKNMLLHGDDILQSIEVNKADIRRQCEAEIRTKILALRKMLFSKDEVVKNQDLLYKTLTSIIVLLKQVFRLKGLPLPQSRKEVLTQLEDYFKRPFDGIKNLYHMREERFRITKTIVETLILNYIADLEFFGRVFNEEE